MTRKQSYLAALLAAFGRRGQNYAFDGCEIFLYHALYNEHLNYWIELTQDEINYHLNPFNGHLVIKTMMTSNRIIFLRFGTRFTHNHSLQFKEVTVLSPSSANQEHEMNDLPSIRISL